MKQSSNTKVTQLLHRAGAGDEQAMHELIPLVYDDLHRIAERRLRGKAGRGSPPEEGLIQPTSLIHEVYIRLIDRIEHIDWRSRAHFYALAAGEMRRVLVDEYRKRNAAKRGGGQVRLTLTEVGGAVASEKGENETDVLALDEALNELKTLNPRHHDILQMHYFGGMTRREIAAVIDMSEETVKKDLQFARAWLGKRMGGKGV